MRNNWYSGGGPVHRSHSGLKGGQVEEEEPKHQEQEGGILAQLPRRPELHRSKKMPGSPESLAMSRTNGTGKTGKVKRKHSQETTHFPNMLI